MSNIKQRTNLADGRKGARFKKKLTTSDSALGGKITDAGISHHFTDVFDGQFNFFPIMEVLNNGNSVGAGKVPIGKNVASVTYLLQFPTISPPNFGSADLDSINLHLYGDDINYKNDYSLPGIEIYKFKKDLPHVGRFGNIRLQKDSTTKPERLVVGSATYSGGSVLKENFDGSDDTTPANFTVPSLYRGGSKSTSVYYSPLADALKINNRSGSTGKDDVNNGRQNADDFDEAYCVNWDGYGRVVRYEFHQMYGGSQHMVRPTSQNGALKTWGDDPRFFLPYYNWNYAVYTGETKHYREELIHDQNNISSISTADSTVDTNVFAQLTAATMTTDNTFFDNIFYCDTERAETIDSGTNQKNITAVSLPHFSTAGGSGGGQVGRLFNRIEDTNTTKMRSYRGDKTAASYICLEKQIPKPLKIARKDGSADELSNMKIRIKFMVNSMTKSHRSGDLSALENHVVGCNLLRSFVVMLSTRRTHHNETLGLYLNRLNSGNTTSSVTSAVDTDGTFDAGSMYVTKDHMNEVTISNSGNSQSRVNSYNGVALMNFNFGSGFQLTCDTNTSANNVVTHTEDADRVPKTGQTVTGTGIPPNSIIIDVDSTTQFKISNEFTTESDSVVLTFHNGIIDNDVDSEQSNNNPDDGVFTLFNTGNKDGSTRINHWDGYYQKSPNRDTSVTDFIPFVHKEAGTQAAGGPVSLSRDGNTFTNLASNIISQSPDRGAYTVLDDEDTGMALTTKNWYYLDAYLNQTAPYITWVVSDDSERVIASVQQAHSGNTLGSTLDHAGKDFPCYLQIWNSNIKVGNIANSGRGEHVGAVDKGFFSAYTSSEVDILIDDISISNYEPKVNNITVNTDRVTVPDIKIDGNEEDEIPDLGSITIGQKIPSVKVNNLKATAPTYLSWGTHTDVWSGKVNNIFMGGFKSNNPAAEDALDADKRVKYGMAADADSQIRFFTMGNATNHPMGFGCIDLASQHMGNGPNINPHVDIGQSAYKTGATKMMVDSFTKKGFITIDNPKYDADLSGSEIDGTFVARENPMFSTKILSYDEANPTKIKVANVDTLMTYKDDNFIIYRAGYAFTVDAGSSAFFRTGLKIENITESGEVTFDIPKSARDITKANDNGPLIHPNHMHELYISPEKYWILAEIYNETADNNLLPAKNYNHSFLLNDDYDTDSLFITKGLTYDESLYSDTSIPSNKWSHLGSISKTSLIENRVDYGFGSYQDEKSVANDGESGLGYINKVTPADGENIIDIGGLVEVEKGRLTDTDENITLMISSSNDTKGGSSIITTKHSDSSKHPALTYVYRDELPEITNFSVAPSEADPFYPEFSWKSDADDLWYGFLIFDTEIIDHQYHKATMHIPLNEVPSGQKDAFGYGMDLFDIGLESFAYTYVRGGTDKTGNTREIGSSEISVYGDRFTTNLLAASDIEGLAGNCLRFDGDVSTEKKVAFAGYNFAQASNALSIVAHITVDSLTKIGEQTDDKGYIVFADDSFGIWVDENGKVNASVTTGDETVTCTLISSYTVPVGNGVPTNIILTVDNSILTGNCKLFVNGNLEDQTGKKTIAGGANNWKDQQIIEPQSKNLYIGCELTDSTNVRKNFFNGIIEEVVIYNIPIYPVNPKENKITIYKPIQELTGGSSIAAGRPINARLFIKDYHNIRGTTVEEVASTSQIAIRKSGLGLKTN